MRALSGLITGYALISSFCTFKKSAEQMHRLIDEGHRLVLIMLGIAFSTDTRFNRAQDQSQKIEEFCDYEIWHIIVQVEPIGPRRLVDLTLIIPCTGSTLAKMVRGVMDTAVTVATKFHLRVGGSVLLVISISDALSAAAQNVGRLTNTRHIYFVPMAQDDPENRPNSVVSDFSPPPVAMLNTVQGEQM